MYKNMILSKRMFTKKRLDFLFSIRNKKNIDDVSSLSSYKIALAVTVAMITPGLAAS